MKSVRNTPPSAVYNTDTIRDALEVYTDVHRLPRRVELHRETSELDLWLCAGAIRLAGWLHPPRILLEQLLKLLDPYEPTTRGAHCTLHRARGPYNVRIVEP